MKIAEWFLNKEFSDGERYAMSTAREVEIIKETEKAVQIKWHTDFGNITRWIPKSLINNNGSYNKGEVKKAIRNDGVELNIVKITKDLAYADNGKVYLKSMLKFI